MSVKDLDPVKGLGPVKEKKLIKLSLIILFLALLMVYLLLYQVKGKNMKQSLTPQITDEQGIVISVNSGDITTIIEPETITEGSDTGYDKMVDSLKNTDTTLSQIRMLSGTKLFYGKIDAIEKLGITYQYALIDGSGTYLINLGSPSYDFESIARALGGNIYKIATEQELAKNKLFGDKVIYINLPEYKDKLVLMLEYIGKEVWLIQIQYKLYHSAKGYLKSLFID